jgi:hemerythrin-like domain-containing protein
MLPVNEVGKCVGDGATLDQPLEHLLACHRRIEQRLDTLDRAADALDTRPDEARQAIDRVLRFLETNGAWHTQDEECSIFPRLRSRLDADALGYLDELAAQHGSVERAVAELRAAPPPEVAERARRAAQAYRAHIAFEESRLLDVARAALGDADLAAIAAEMKHRRGL